eukprot:7495106-Prorocentrum_lima.AAC.1
MTSSLVGSEMCIRDSFPILPVPLHRSRLPNQHSDAQHDPCALPTGIPHSIPRHPFSKTQILPRQWRPLATPGRKPTAAACT